MSRGGEAGSPQRGRFAERRSRRRLSPSPAEPDSLKRKLNTAPCSIQRKVYSQKKSRICLKKIYLYIFRVNYFIEMTVKVSFSRHLHISQVSDKRYTRGRFCLISVFSLVALEPARLWLQDTRLYRHLIKLNRVRISRDGWSLC